MVRQTGKLPAEDWDRDAILRTLDQAVKEGKETAAAVEREARENGWDDLAEQAGEVAVAIEIEEANARERVEANDRRVQAARMALGHVAAITKTATERDMPIEIAIEYLEEALVRARPLVEGILEGQLDGTEQTLSELKEKHAEAMARIEKALKEASEHIERIREIRRVPLDGKAVKRALKQLRSEARKAQHALGRARDVAVQYRLLKMMREALKTMEEFNTEFNTTATVLETQQDRLFEVQDAIHHLMTALDTSDEEDIPLSQRQERLRSAMDEVRNAISRYPVEGEVEEIAEALLERADRRARHLDHIYDFLRSTGRSTALSNKREARDLVRFLMAEAESGLVRLEAVGDLEDALVHAIKVQKELTIAAYLIDSFGLSDMIDRLEEITKRMEESSRRHGHD